MAIPEQRDPNLPRTHIDDLGDVPKVERASRGGWRWWWIWPVVIAVVLWWAGWGWGSSGGWWWGHAHAQSSRIPAPPGARTTETLANAGAEQPETANGAAGPRYPMTGSGVQVLAAENKTQFVGQQFQIKEAPIQQKVNDHAMWIGSSNTKPMLAIVSGNTSSNNVDQGTVVDASGTVKKAPSVSQAEHEWSIPAQDAQKMEQEGAYIQLSQLDVPQQ